MFGDKIQRQKILLCGWLAHCKGAKMAAKIRPVRVMRGDVDVPRDFCVYFFKARAMAPFPNQFALGQKTIGGH